MRHRARMLRDITAPFEEETEVVHEQTMLRG